MINIGKIYILVGLSFFLDVYFFFLLFHYE